MSTIIKAADHNLDVQRVVFNLDDMTARADRHIDRLRGEAAAIVAKAQKEADAVRRRAEEEGRKEGLQAVEQMVDNRLGQQLATLMPALKKVVGDLHDARHAWLGHWEKSVVHVAAEIAKRLVRRELANDPEITLALVREALDLAAGNPSLRILLNPKDHETLLPRVESLIKELASMAQTQVVADPAITPGGCRVETTFGSIDQQFEAQLARIEEELT